MTRKVILIAGASGSGKTTLAERLATCCDATILKTDDYYRPLDHLTYEERCDANFDAPESVDGTLLTAHVGELIAGNPIKRPCYDFTRHTRRLTGEEVAPRECVIVEGLFALCYPELRNLATYSIFVDTGSELCLDRRIRRDVAERGRTPDEVVWRFRNHVYPMYLRYVAPTQSFAHKTVSGASDDGFNASIVALGGIITSLSLA